jgi:hypothetical protein
MQAPARIPADGDGGGGDPFVTFISLLLANASDRGEFLAAAIKREIEAALDAMEK